MMMNYIKVLEITCASVSPVCVSQGSRGIGNLLCCHTYQRYVLSFCLGSAMQNITSRNSLKGYAVSSFVCVGIVALDALLLAMCVLMCKLHEFDLWLSHPAVS